MSIKRWIWLFLGLVIVLVGALASLSTVRAGQLHDEAAARLQDEQARQLALQHLESARRDGLRPAEIGAVLSRFHKVDTEHPSALMFWDTGATFYRQRAVTYRSVARAADQAVLRVTGLTRQEARQAVAALAQSIAKAPAYDVPVTAPVAWLAHVQAVFNRSRTPRDYRFAAHEARKVNKGLVAAIASQQRIAAQVLAHYHTATAITAQSALEARAAQGLLPVLGILTGRASTEGQELSAALLRERQAATAEQAAIRSVAVAAAAGQIRADYAKTVPAKMVVVSTEQQEAWAYENGKVVLSTPVTTGGPELPTDHGIFHIYFKASPFLFHSPWPPGSPYYYNPTWVQFWMPFDGGEGLHDASWRSNFGPGSNVAPTDLGTGNYILGTHGCVNLPYDAAQFIWNWAPVGTTVVVQ